ERFDGTPEGGFAMGELGIDEIDGHLPDHEPAGDSHEGQDEDDGDDGDEEVGHDEAIAQSPDGLFHAAAGEAEEGNHAEENGEDRGASLQDGRDGREAQDDVEDNR